MEQRPHDLIADWNDVATPVGLRRPIAVHDETLRDGLQSPTVRHPSIDERLELLHLMSALGIESVDLGMPVTSAAEQANVTRLAAEISAERLPIRPTCAARTTKEDIAAVARASQSAGIEIEVMAFVGTSPIRLYVEQWRLEDIVREVDELVAFARGEGLPVCLVTEDTTRSRLDAATAVYTAGLDAGAERICVCDTVGFAMPWGAAELVRSLRTGLGARGFDDTLIDWHGHNDRGMAVANSLAAAAAGADRLHGAALGIGERTGNTSIEQLLVNLHDLGPMNGDLTLLERYCTRTAEVCGVAVPFNQPFVGADAYRTATGVHAAAIRKAMQRNDAWLAERVYAGVPASRLGREQRIDVGPGSGHANVLYWLDRHGIGPADDVVAVLMDAVAVATRTYTDDELFGIVDRLRAAPVASPGVPVAS